MQEDYFPFIMRYAKRSKEAVEYLLENSLLKEKTVVPQPSG